LTEDQDVTQHTFTDPNRTYARHDQPARLFGQDDSGTESAQPLFEGPQSYDVPPTPITDIRPPSADIDNKRKIIQPLAPPDETHQLAQLESVAPLASSSVDNFFGTSRPAVVDEIEPATQTLDSNAPISLPAEPDPQPAIQPDMQQEAHIEEPIEEPASTPAPALVDPIAQQPMPQVIDPTAPPEVPPPLLPQANTLPQFYDADGNNNNPFLNPSK
jgi:hypothetical protein